MKYTKKIIGIMFTMLFISNIVNVSANSMMILDTDLEYSVSEGDVIVWENLEQTIVQKNLTHDDDIATSESVIAITGVSITLDVELDDMENIYALEIELMDGTDIGEVFNVSDVLVSGAYLLFTLEFDVGDDLTNYDVDVASLVDLRAVSGYYTHTSEDIGYVLANITHSEINSLDDDKYDLGYDVWENITAEPNLVEIDSSAINLTEWQIDESVNRTVNKTVLSVIQEVVPIFPTDLVAEAILIEDIVDVLFYLLSEGNIDSTGEYVSFIELMIADMIGESGATLGADNLTETTVIDTEKWTGNITYTMDISLEDVVIESTTVDFIMGFSFMFAYSSDPSGKANITFTRTDERLILDTSGNVLDEENQIYTSEMCIVYDSNPYTEDIDNIEDDKPFYTEIWFIILIVSSLFVGVVVFSILSYRKNNCGKDDNVDKLICNGFEQKQPLLD